jgi:type VI secretion system secreted protein VgrG
VKKNDDPDGQGRVRVQLHWQEQDTMTDWIQVMSPDGGSSDKVAKNRGFVFIPEVGGLVMVGYRDGNCDAPFVLGSLPHGPASGGGGKGNKTKSLTSRSGSTVSLDDEKGSITVSDPSGNTVILHGDGTMTIHAPNKLTISSKEIHLLAENDLNLASANTKVTVSGKSEVNLSSEGKLSVQAVAELTVTSEASLKLAAPAVEAGADAALKLSGATVDVAGQATTTIKGGIVNIN